VLLAGFGCAGILGSSSAAPALDNAVVGTVAALRGGATLTQRGATAPANLAVGSELHDGDDIRTGPESRVRLALSDGSSLSLGADTEFKVDHLAVGAPESNGPSKFSLYSGFVRAVVAPVNTAPGFEIQTPSMVAAVRGTDWIENYVDNASEIFVVRGRVLTSGVTSQAADQIELSAGEGVSFMSSGARTPVVRWNQAKIDRFVAATSAP
jgi:hypothetical protein